MRTIPSTPLNLSGFAIVCSALLAGPIAGQTYECLECEEIYTDTVEVPYYEHRFDSSGDVHRRCYAGGSGTGPHSGCHNNWVEDACEYPHTTCSDNIAAVLEVHRLIAGAAVNDHAAAALATTIAREPAVRLTARGERIQILDCAGVRLVAEWRLPPNVQRRLAGVLMIGRGAVG